MGLKDMSIEELQEFQKFLKIFAIFGITEEDLFYLKDALSIVRGSGRQAVVQPPKKENIEIPKNISGKTIIEEAVNYFEDKVEGFYPDGKPKENKRRSN